ncbi:MAG: cupin domain-containing protein [Chitinophagaceae bacterium]|nr:cupin domain-containing protein [Chitinophagaceae bacterium]
MNVSKTYYPFGQHKILADKETGSAYWSITGKDLQFTWFEVAPETNFAEHKHNSEQITFVLEGELFFKIENEVYKLSAGDSIMIPSNKEHSVWTGSVPAKAVDAWSPINQKYLSI